MRNNTSHTSYRPPWDSILWQNPFNWGITHPIYYTGHSGILPYDRKTPSAVLWYFQSSVILHEVMHDACNHIRTKYRQTDISSLQTSSYIEFGDQQHLIISHLARAQKGKKKVLFNHSYYLCHICLPLHLNLQSCQWYLFPYHPPFAGIFPK